MNRKHPSHRVTTWVAAFAVGGLALVPVAAASASTSPTRPRRRPASRPT